MSQREITFDDGVTTVLESWGSGGPNVLCLHGATSSRKSWARVAGGMELAYAVHAYDQRGHGDLAAVHGPMKFTRLVRDCAQAQDAIAGGIDTLIGHSWGGATALLAGLELPVSRVVAIDPLFHVRRLSWHDYWHEGMDAIFAVHGADRERKIMEDYAGLPQIEIDAKIHALRNMVIDPLLRIGDENGADEGKLDLREAIVNYPKPLLMMLADPEESVVHADDVAFIRQHGGANVTVHVFEGQGHSPHRTAFEDFMRVLDAFLSVPA